MLQQRRDVVEAPRRSGGAGGVRPSWRRPNGCSKSAYYQEKHRGRCGACAARWVAEHPDGAKRPGGRRARADSQGSGGHFLFARQSSEA